MSCSVCAGYDDYNCPCCGTAKTVRCKECDDGLQYFMIDIRNGKEIQCTALAYEIGPFDEEDARAERKNFYQGAIRRCPVCKGEGEIFMDGY